MQAEDFGEAHAPGPRASGVDLFRPKGSPGGASLPRVQVVRSVTKRAGTDFCAPTQFPPPDDLIERIHQRAETVTPLLKRILQRRDALGHAQAFGANCTATY